MASLNDAQLAVFEEFERVRQADLSAGGKATLYLKLAEAYAWLANPSQPHGGNVQVSSGK